MNKKLCDFTTNEWIDCYQCDDRKDCPDTRKGCGWIIGIIIIVIVVITIGVTNL
jgi:hypothetical protein